MVDWTDTGFRNCRVSFGGRRVKILMRPGHSNSIIRQGAACGQCADAQVGSGSALETGTCCLCPDVGAPNDNARRTRRPRASATPHQTESVWIGTLPLFAQNSFLFFEVIDHSQLPPVHPASERDYEEPERVEDIHTDHRSNIVAENRSLRGRC